MADVQFPEMRAEVMSAVRSLASLSHQRLRWGVWDDGSASYFEDLTLVVNVLYDDTGVVPQPSGSVGAILHEAETDAFLALDAALSPIIDDLSEAPDTDYLSDPRWLDVLQSAGACAAAMEAAWSGSVGGPAGRTGRMTDEAFSLLDPAGHLTNRASTLLLDHLQGQEGDEPT